MLLAHQKWLQFKLIHHGIAISKLPSARRHLHWCSNKLLYYIDVQILIQLSYLSKNSVGTETINNIQKRIYSKDSPNGRIEQIPGWQRISSKTSQKNSSTNDSPIKQRTEKKRVTYQNTCWRSIWGQEYCQYLSRQQHKNWVSAKRKSHPLNTKKLKRNAKNISTHKCADSRIPWTAIKQWPPSTKHKHRKRNRYYTHYTAQKPMRHFLSKHPPREWYGTAVRASVSN